MIRLVDVNRLLATDLRPEIADCADEAWVIDGRARTSDPRPLEQATRDWCQSVGRPRLRPQPVVVPGRARELEQHIRRMQRVGGVSVVRMCPGPDGHGYPLEPWAVSPLPELCERERFALALDFPSDGPPPWAEVVQLARAYPRVPIVLLDAVRNSPWAPSRALDAASNLLLGVSAQTAPAALASLVGEQGSHRFVFGSGTSDLAAGTAFALVAGLASEADAEAILSRNADLLDAGDWGEMFL